MTEIINKKAAPKIELKAVVPGPRALGMPWMEVSVGSQEGELYTSVEKAEAPTETSILAMGEDAGWFRDVMEAQRGKQTEGAFNKAVTTGEGRCTDLLCSHRHNGCSAYRLMNEMFQNYIEQKTRWFKGQSTYGYGGHTQREKAG